MFILVNDYLHGLMNERVLWDFMLEGIPGLVKVDYNVIANNPAINNLQTSFENKVSLYIELNYPTYTAIIQNGSWFNLIPSNKPRIILIQDNLRKMRRISPIQELNFKKAEYVITNSNEVDEYYNERTTTQIQLGVDNKLFIPMNKDVLRQKYKIFNTHPHIGIFVGALNEVKGWSRILRIIINNPEILWIIVSKHIENEVLPANTILFTQISQIQLCELYNCADFFIIGSESETQCLAAIESCLCNVPIIMRNTGFVNNLSSFEKNQVGIIGENIENSVRMITQEENVFNPRNTIIDYYSLEKMCDKWISFLNTI